MGERALAIKLREYGPNHREVAITLTNLGSAYGDLGDAATSRDLLERSLRIKEREFGRMHVSSAVARTNLAIALRACGELRAAIEQMQTALRAFETHGHPHRSTAARNLSLFQMELANRD